MLERNEGGRGKRGKIRKWRNGGGGPVGCVLCVYSMKQREHNRQFKAVVHIQPLFSACNYLCGQRKTVVII